MQILVLALAACGISRAAADPLAVRTAGTLPFSPAQLEAALALRARLATASSLERLEAKVTADGAGVRIELAGRSRSVALDGERGEDAARLVAFAVLDLAGDRLDPPAPPEVHGDDDPGNTTPPRETASVAAPETPARDALPAPPRSRPAWSFAAWGATGSRTTAMLEVSRRVSGPLRAVVVVGASLEQTTSAMDVAVARRGFPLRLGMGWRVGPLEVRATGVAVIERASAERTATSAMFGGGAAVVYAAPASIGGFTLVAGAGADVFARAIDYRVHGAPIAMSERFAWWTGLGILREARR